MKKWLCGTIYVKYCTDHNEQIIYKQDFFFYNRIELKATVDELIFKYNVRVVANMQLSIIFD